MRTSQNFPVIIFHFLVPLSFLLTFQHCIDSDFSLHSITMFLLLFHLTETKMIFAALNSNIRSMLIDILNYSIPSTISDALVLVDQKIFTGASNEALKILKQLKFALNSRFDELIKNKSSNQINFHQICVCWPQFSFSDSIKILNRQEINFYTELINKKLKSLYLNTSTDSSDHRPSLQCSLHSRYPRFELAEIINVEKIELNASKFDFPNSINIESTTAAIEQPISLKLENAVKTARRSSRISSIVRQKPEQIVEIPNKKRTRH